MAMTYQDLLANIMTMSPEQLQTNVTVFVSGVGEFYPLVDDFPYVIADQEIQNEFTPGAGDGVLDDGHPYLVI